MASAADNWTIQGFAGDNAQPTLDLRRCRGVVAVLASLRTIQKPELLRTVNGLDLCFQTISAEEICELAIEFAKLPKLSYLQARFQCSHINESAVRELGFMLAKLTELKGLHLDFGSCMIDDVGARGLAIGLANLKRLTSLTLSLANNRIGSDGLKSLTFALAELRLLMHFRFDFHGNNPSSAIAAEYFASVLANLQPLCGRPISMGALAKPFNDALQAQLARLAERTEAVC